MQNLKVNKADITTVREAFRVPLFDLIALMQNKGWDFNLSADDPTRAHGWVSFEKHEEWNGRPTLANTPKLGYRFEKDSEDRLLAAAQRAAELAITVQEMFGRYLPGNSNIHGDIQPCPISNQDRYVNLDYPTWKAGHKDKELTFLPEGYLTKDGIAFSYWGHLMLFDGIELPGLLETFDAILQKADGTFAYD